MAWLAQREGRPGRKPVYSDAAIQFCLSIKVLFKLPLRQTAGMAASLLQMDWFDWAVPVFSTLSCWQKTLAVQISYFRISVFPYRRIRGPLSLLVDSTGITFLGDGEWRKVHLAMDTATSDIRAVHSLSVIAQQSPRGNSNPSATVPRGPSRPDPRRRADLLCNR